MVIVFVRIDGERIAEFGSKQGQIFGMLGYCFGLADTTDVMVQAQHLIGRCHDEVKVVGDQKDATTLFVPDSANEIVELALTNDVHARAWFVED